MNKTAIRKFFQGKFQQQVGSNLLAQGSIFVLSFLNAAIIARVIGPDGTGILVLVSMLSGVLALLFNGGISIAIVYYVGNKQIDVADITSNAIGFALLAALIGNMILLGLLLLGWISKIIPNISTQAIILAMVNFPILIISSILVSILQGLQEIIKISARSIVQWILNLLLSILCVVILKWGTVGAIVALICSGLINLVLLALLVKRDGIKLRPSLNMAVLRQMLTFGLKGYVGNLFQYFNYRLDSFIVNLFLGPASVGLYSVSVSIAELLWYLPNAVSFVIFPKAAASSKDELKTFTPKVFMATLSITFLEAIVLAVMGNLFIKLVFSERFAGSYIPMLLLLPGVVLLGGSKVLSNEMTGRGYPHFNSIIAGISAIITIALDLILIPVYGIQGAAFVSTIVYTLSFFLTIFVYLRLRTHSDIRFIPDWLRISRDL